MPTPADLSHVQAFTAAMARKDLDAMLSHMTADAVLNTPLLPGPVRGQDAIRAVVGPLLAVVDAFDFQEILTGPSHVASFFKVIAGGQALDGMDFWRLAAEGCIAEMTVLWRPLPAAQAVAALLT